jgi:hypothetical protein
MHPHSLFSIIILSTFSGLLVKAQSPTPNCYICPVTSASGVPLDYTTVFGGTILYCEYDRNDCYYNVVSAYQSISNIQYIMNQFLILEQRKRGVWDWVPVS